VHDILVLIDGRVELTDEMRAESTELRAYVHRGLADLRDHPYFAYAVDSATVGYGPVGQDRAAALRERFDGLVKRLDT
jgi:hypothetical protein